MAPPLLVVSAHPDDEVVSLGSRLPRLPGVTLVHVTDGAPRNGADARAHGFGGWAAYALARRRELESAVALAGIAPAQLRELEVADQAASLHLAAIARRLADLFAELRPVGVVTHPYEGGHPDHDATAFAVHAACRLLVRRREPIPILVEASSYHNGPGGIEVGCFVPRAGAAEAVTVQLSEAECDLKRRMFACFASQQETLQYFPVGVECFRLAPRYDFWNPPHGGRLFYENFPWGMTGQRFCMLAREAEEQLPVASC